MTGGFVAVDARIDSILVGEIGQRIRDHDERLATLEAKLATLRAAEHR